MKMRRGLGGSRFEADGGLDVKIVKLNGRADHAGDDDTLVRQKSLLVKLFRPK